MAFFTWPSRPTFGSVHTQPDALWPALAPTPLAPRSPWTALELPSADEPRAAHLAYPASWGLRGGASNLCCVTNTRRARQTRARAQPWPRTRTLVLQLLHFNMDGPGSYASLGCQVPLPRSVAPSPPARNPVATPSPSHTLPHAHAHARTRTHTSTYTHTIHRE